MKTLLLISLILTLISHIHCHRACEPSVTKVSGSKAPSEICSGDLIFNDDFSSFDLTTWQHENTLAGGGNWEFQWYTNNRTNSFTKDGILNIRPTLVSDEYGEKFLTTGTVNLHGGAPADECTNPSFYGCERAGSSSNIINPIKSARIRTVNSFSFRYGKVEVSAKLPQGDWLWPAIWLMPRYNQYGYWPSSGEIDMMESRGNRKLYKNGVNIGAEQVGSTLHFGPNWAHNKWPLATNVKNNDAGYYDKFHLYQLEWTPDFLKISIDNEVVLNIKPTEKGFWELGHFDPSLENIWTSGTKMAPFDEEFYLIINLAVGGVNGYFPDDATNPGGKPWLNTSPTAAADFWKAKNIWYPSWDTQNSTLQIDYVKIWAL